MEVKVLKSEEINRAIADTFIELIKRNPKAVLGLATGSSPVGVYQNLVKAYKEGVISCDPLRSF